MRELTEWFVLAIVAAIYATITYVVFLTQGNLGPAEVFVIGVVLLFLGIRRLWLRSARNSR